MIKRFKLWYKQKFCKHLFYGKDMIPRNDEGIVKWPCSKCGKMFSAENGLEILKNGKMGGSW